MSYMIPVGRPLYEGVATPTPQDAASSAPAPKPAAAAASGSLRDQVTLSPEAQAYLNSQKPATPQQDRAPPPPKPLLDETV